MRIDFIIMWFTAQARAIRWRPSVVWRLLAAVNCEMQMQ